MSIKRIVSALVAGLLFFSCPVMTAFAEVALPEGAVKGLPERLAALDNEGRAVNSATGEYFFHVEDMQYGEVYYKEVQLMNLREDQGYHIYFSVEPLYKDGEIDLEKGCECTFYLDGNQVYKGDVNGHGNIDLTEKPLDCGWYNPGDSHVIRAEVVWNDIDVIQNVDNGHRLVDVDGEHVLVGPNGSGHAEGEIEFKWIFYASVYEISSYTDETQETTAPYSDVKANTTVQTTDYISDQETTNASTDNIIDQSKQTQTLETAIGGDDDSMTSRVSMDETDDQMSGRQTTSTVTTVTTERTTEGNTPGSGNQQSGGFLTPFTGHLSKDGTVWLVCMGVFGVMIIVLLILIHRKKREKKKEK